MPEAGRITIRNASRADSGDIAALHAESWRRNYRGAYSDEFLDGDVLSDRRSTWSQRLNDDSTSTATFVAETPDATLAGFAHVAFDADAQWGALLDNLHVTNELKRTGIGTRLIAEVAKVTLDRRQKLHLYVLEQNTGAQAFYQARGGRFVEASLVSAPGGVVARLRGSPRRHLYVWDDPTTLLH